MEISQSVVNGAIALGAGVGGWFLKVIWEGIKSLERDVQGLRSELHTEYLSKADYRQDMARIFDLLTRIDGKLDHKVDKVGAD